jgi:hypothetical protein
MQVRPTTWRLRFPYSKSSYPGPARIPIVLPLRRILPSFGRGLGLAGVKQLFWKKHTIKIRRVNESGAMRTFQKESVTLIKQVET